MEQERREFGFTEFVLERLELAIVLPFTEAQRNRGYSVPERSFLVPRLAKVPLPAGKDFHDDGASHRLRQELRGRQIAWTRFIEKP